MLQKSTFFLFRPESISALLGESNLALCPPPNSLYWEMKKWLGAISLRFSVVGNRSCKNTTMMHPSMPVPEYTFIVPMMFENVACYAMQVWPLIADEGPRDVAGQHSGTL
jgi:hypothetical protein